jgi:hypothetical protein
MILTPVTWDFSFLTGSVGATESLGFSDRLNNSLLVTFEIEGGLIERSVGDSGLLGSIGDVATTGIFSFFHFVIWILNLYFILCAGLLY